MSVMALERRPPPFSQFNMVTRQNSHRPIGLRASLLLALAALLAWQRQAAAQTSQSGLLYWCSLIENGSNMGSTGFSNIPR